MTTFINLPGASAKKWLWSVGAKAVSTFYGRITDSMRMDPLASAVILYVVRDSVDHAANMANDSKAYLPPYTTDPVLKSIGFLGLRQNLHVLRCCGALPPHTS
ncbi:hypothetical protein GN958_ATG21849 [Phytophthora infestans]|uniref:Uncharacterized protein n=1 Tax=Phytophthora infestans TaxID=4787 RepID=A0A8S9TMP8_PHYIN|nr:hypothetical protein GN958_ATG21849 [Phytophthora infestans]